MHCAEVSHADMMVAHHELGHIYYYMEYKDLPMVYKQGANPGIQLQI